MRWFNLRWAILFFLTLPLLSLQVMSCGKDSPSAGASCNNDDECGDGQFCLEGECEEEDEDVDDECPNFYSCETSQDCVDLNRGFTICDGNCCF